MYCSFVHTPYPQQTEIHIHPHTISRSVFCGKWDGCIDLRQKSRAWTRCSSQGAQLGEPLRAPWMRAVATPGAFKHHKPKKWLGGGLGSLDQGSPSPSGEEKHRQRGSGILGLPPSQSLTCRIIARSVLSCCGKILDFKVRCLGQVLPCHFQLNK